jgi:hypothetical protein
MGGKKLTNVAAPAHTNDAVSLEYLNANALTMSKDHFNAKTKKIQALKDPDKADEAVTLNYLQKNCIQFPKSTKYIDLKQSRFTDAGGIPHNEPNTLVSAKYVKDVALCVSHNFDVPDPTGNHYDARNKNIQNVRDPVADADAVNFKTLTDKSLCLSESLPGLDHANVYDAKRNIIRNVKAPEGAWDAANKQYVDYGTKVTFQHVATAPPTPASSEHVIVKFASTAGPQSKFLEVKNDSFLVKYDALLRITLYIEADTGTFEVIMGDFVKRFNSTNFSHNFMLNVEAGKELQPVTMKTIRPFLKDFRLWIIFEKIV